MIDKIKDLFSQKMDPDDKEIPGESGKVSVATCALLMEMAHADSEFDDEEKNNIISILKENFSLGDQDVAELMDLAEQERQESIDLWQFTNLINQNYSHQEKIKVVETLWTVIYTDGRVDQHEDYLMRKLAFLLDLDTSDMVDAKLRVREKFE
jgi:uncharacterized tellurite resistance protein B-like protein